jgi:hypothetical protein
MAQSQEELVRFGARRSTERILAQAEVSLRVAREHAAALGSKFPPSKTDRIEALLGQVRGLYDVQAEKKVGAATGNVPVQELVGQAKDWIRDVRTAADNAFEREPEVRDEFHKGGVLGSSVPKLLARLTSMLALAEVHKTALAEWGVTPEDVAAGRKLVTDLKNADATQEQALKNLPPKTRELNEAKGELYLLLKALARTGRRVFKSNPALANQLSLDILGRTGGGAARPEQPAAPA